MDLGRLLARVDAATGETAVTEDTRQSGLPRVAANRAMREINAVFG